jgi:hypothetical protein
MEMHALGFMVWLQVEILIQLRILDLDQMQVSKLVIQRAFANSVQVALKE